MTTTEKRIQNTEKKLNKFYEKLERIKVALAGGKNSYSYSESDLDRTNDEIEYLETKLIEYKDKHKKEVEEANSRVPVIEEFLKVWKDNAHEYYKNEHKELKKFKKDYEHRKNEFKLQLEREGVHVWGMKLEERAKEVGLDWKTYKETLQFKFSSVIQKCDEYGYSWENKLESILETEKKAKRKMLMARVQEVVGTILDASELYIANNGEINGFITGDKGKAEVRTILAGGYNIQCLHFRVLVREL